MNPLSALLMRLARLLERLWIRAKLPGRRRLPPLDEDVADLPFAAQAFQKLVDAYSFDTVLDVGSGQGLHADAFLRRGKHVTALDYGESVYFRKREQDAEDRLATLVADFNHHPFHQTFDCVWCSHVLEHQLDPQGFLTKVHGVLREGGVLAITVPPLKHEIVGGHVSLWNAGLLLYRLVLAGFDCRQARVLSADYDISVVVEKRSIDVLDTLEYDMGDVRKIRPYLPADLPFRPHAHDDPFDGNIRQLGW